MMVETTQADFKRLADIRLVEAKILIDQLQDWDGASYLAGYAIEFTLKARIIGNLIRTGTFPNRNLFDNFYKHDLSTLRRLAILEEEMQLDVSIQVGWQIVVGWSEQSRYKFGTTEKEAKDLYTAIESKVLPWIKDRW